MTALADRVKESTTTTGTGSLTLSGAVTQFESFNTAFGTAAPFYYVITDANGTDWEVGTGELSNATTLVRTTVHQSSNADAKINLSAGTHTVFCSAPAVFLAGLASKSGKLSQFAATTSAELAGVISDETGSGALVFATSPTLTTPNIGVATATSVNGTTIPSSKTLVVTTDKLSALAATTSAELAGVISDETGTGSLVFASSPSLTTPNIGAATATSVNGTTIPSSKTLVVTTDKLSALAATTSAELAGVISDETGSGSLVFATSPSLTTPNIGTPSAGTLTNCTGLPVGGVSGLGTGVGTALAVNTGSAGAFVVNGGALGTPSSGTLTNATGLPVSTGVSGLGSGVATALAVNTGSSGAVVVNGGALGTPSSGTVTNLTGTASININGTVGATTANTGAFTTLSATGVATFSAGTAAAPAITTSGDTNNGIYFPAADNVAITTGGTQRVLVDSSGNVGIGTSSPSDKLQIEGTGTAPVASIRSTTTGSVNQAALNLFRGDSTNGFAQFGVGTTSTNTWQFGLRSGSTSWQLYDVGASTARVVVDTSGNVGIGTSSPAALLHIEKNAAAEIGEFIYNPNASGYAALRIGNSDRATNGDHLIYGSSVLGLRSKTGAAITFEPAGTERMRIDSSGNVFIGATAALNGSRLYAVTTGSAIAGGFKNDSAGYQTVQIWNADTSGTRNLIQFSAGSGGTSVGLVSTDGTNTTYGTSSDYRLKDNIQPMTGALEKVTQLKPCTYTWKETGASGQGFIAHELQAVVPDAVVGDKDAVNEDGSIKPQNIDTSFLVATLTAAIQEQQQQIDALKAEVAALKGNA